MSKTIELWIARDKYGDDSLWLFKKEPYECNDEGVWDSGDGACRLLPDIFPQITFENSPKRIELKIIDDE
jgi:hypothetical protein